MSDIVKFHEERTRMFNEQCQMVKDRPDEAYRVMVQALFAIQQIVSYMNLDQPEPGPQMNLHNQLWPLIREAETALDGFFEPEKVKGDGSNEAVDVAKAYYIEPSVDIHLSKKNLEILLASLNETRFSTKGELDELYTNGIMTSLKRTKQETVLEEHLASIKKLIAYLRTQLEEMP